MGYSGRFFGLPCGSVIVGDGRGWRAATSFGRQQCLYFFPLPQGQGSKDRCGKIDDGPYSPSDQLLDVLDQPVVVETGGLGRVDNSWEIWVKYGHLSTPQRGLSPATKLEDWIDYAI